MGDSKYVREYLKSARLEKGYSNRKLARLAHLTHQHYLRIESGGSKGRISLRTMGLIAKALEMPLEKIYDLEMDYLKRLGGYCDESPED